MSNDELLGGVADDDRPLRLLSVHAHPDDESSKGAGTVALLSDAGVRCVLVCCTGGADRKSTRLNSSHRT